MLLRTFATCLLMGILSLGSLSCASSSNIPVREMPANATFSGQWYTTFGFMDISQRSDGYARGTFDYKSGGEVEGTVVGGVFQFRWVQPGDFSVGRREVSGHGYLVISDDGLNMSGRWGYNDAYEGGGEWTGKKQTEIYR